MAATAASLPLASLESPLGRAANRDEVRREPPGLLVEVEAETLVGAGDDASLLSLGAATARCDAPRRPTADGGGDDGGGASAVEEEEEDEEEARVLRVEALDREVAGAPTVVAGAAAVVVGGAEVVVGADAVVVVVVVGLAAPALRVLRL